MYAYVCMYLFVTSSCFDSAPKVQAIFNHIDQAAEWSRLDPVRQSFTDCDQGTSNHAYCEPHGGSVSDLDGSHSRAHRIPYDRCKKLRDGNLYYP
jgi:hypothetical protein